MEPAPRKTAFPLRAEAKLCAMTREVLHAPPPALPLLSHLRYFTSPSFSSSSLFLLHKDWSLVPNHSTSRRCLEFISLYCIIIFCLDNCKHIICLSFPISTSLQTIFLIAFHSLNPVMTLSSVKPFGGFPLWTKQCLTPWHTQNALHSLASFYPSRLVCCHLPP